MKHIEYSYDLYDKTGRVKGGPLSEKHYNDVINSDLKLKKEWNTKFKSSTLYAREYDLEDGWILFIWKEVFD